MAKVNFDKRTLAVQVRRKDALKGISLFGLSSNAMGCKDGINVIEVVFIRRFIMVNHDGLNNVFFSKAFLCSTVIIATTRVKQSKISNESKQKTP